MKCPSCGNNQSFKRGLVCTSCEYEFALHPKLKPYISDKGFIGIVNRLSGPDGNYFTYNQLYGALHRVLRKQAMNDRVLGIVLAVALGFVASWVVGTVLKITLGTGWWPYPLIFLIGVIIAVRVAKKKPAADPTLVTEVIRKYTAKHPIERMTDGTRFEDMDIKHLDRELFQFAPERILILERNDMVDMLLLNRFHVENKTLVVSLQRYPKRAYQGVKHFLSKNPELPVHIMHDASKEGLKMKETLENRKDWQLKGAAITDLGLFPKDVKLLDNPVWRPSGRAAVAGGAARPKATDPQDIIAEGYRMPVDVAPPRAFMGTAALAMLTGAALLSPELLAQQQHVTGDGAASGGFG